MPDGLTNRLKHMNDRIILAVNPGSTSTKFALYRGTDMVMQKTLRHSTE